MDTPGMELATKTPGVNVHIYGHLPPAEAHYQLAHVHESRVYDIVSSHIACLVIAVIAIVLRFVSRRMSKTAIKADDWMIVVALVFAIGYITAVLLCVIEYGGGRHAILLNSPVKFAQSVLAAEVFYPPAIGSVKLSTLFLYSRIFPGRQFRIILYTVGIFVIVYSGIQVLASIFQCIPVRAAWAMGVEGKCIHINLLFIAMAGMNVLTDFVLLIAPLPSLWNLQMQKAMKLQLMALFGIGGFICIVSIYRIPKLYGLSLLDAPWSNADATIWSLVEVSVAIVCACAIVYRPLLNWAFNMQISAAGSGGSRKNSKPKIVGWESNDSVKLQKVKMEGDQGSQGTVDSLSRLKEGGWEEIS